MQPIKLGSEDVLAWQSLLPPDLKELCPPKADPALDEECDELSQALSISSPRRFAETLRARGPLVRRLEPARRILILAYSISRGWDDATRIVSDLTDDGVGTDEEGAAGKIGALFMADCHAVRKIVRQRMINAVSQQETAEAVLRGVGQYEYDYGIGSGGLT